MYRAFSFVLCRSKVWLARVVFAWLFRVSAFKGRRGGDEKRLGLPCSCVSFRLAAQGQPVGSETLLETRGASIACCCLGSSVPIGLEMSPSKERRSFY